MQAQIRETSHITPPRRFRREFLAFLDFAGFPPCYTSIEAQILAMLAIELDAEIEKRLSLLAKKTGRTETYYVREAVLEHLEDLEDIHLATERLQRPAKTHSAEEVKRELGL